jgi:hypothetical protein
LKSDFPLLNAFGGFSTSALSMIEIMTSLSFDERARLAGALVRRVHKEALRLLGQEIEPADGLLIQEWLEASQRTRAMADIGRGASAGRGAIRKALKDRLRLLLGHEREDMDEEHLGFQRVIDHWCVQTNLDVGGRSQQIAYWHGVLFDDALVTSSISPLAWLGITSTKLDRIGKGKEAAAADCVAALVRHFVEAEPVLFPTGAANAPKAP